MKAIRRKTIYQLPHRQAWHNLAAYTGTPVDGNAWKSLRQRDTHVEGIVERFLGGRGTSKKGTKEEIGDRRKEVDWGYWEKNIVHGGIVKCLKSFYEQQIDLLKTLQKENHTKHVESQKHGWELFDSALTKCDASVEASEQIVANGARGLWVSYHNPPLTKVDDNEWLDSDRSWQAVVEKQFLYNPTANIAEEELPKWKQVLKEGWQFKMETINARSDTPVIFQYMDQLPSWEYYDIHRRAFLEHMLYYLLRTGSDYRMFPECPPWQWLAHIEELRYQFIAVTQRRRAAFQLQSEARDLPLDMTPLDAAHDGESFFGHLLAKEANTFEGVAARLMGSYCFLSYPYVPVQTATALYRVIAKHQDGDGGKVYSIGDDVNALFYLPNKYKSMEKLPTPREALNALLDHLTLSGIRLNPGYASMVDIMTQILELRSSSWLTATGESLCDAFMRRLQKDDPSYNIYNTYVQELKARFEAAVEVPEAKLLSEIERVESAYLKECELFEQLQHASDSDTMEQASKDLARLKLLHEHNELQPLLNAGSLVVATNDSYGSSVRVVDAEVLIDDLTDFAESKQFLVEALKAEKLSVSAEPKSCPPPAIPPGWDVTGGRLDMKHLDIPLREFTDK